MGFSFKMCAMLIMKSGKQQSGKLNKKERRLTNKRSKDKQPKLEKEKCEEKQLYGYFKRQIFKIAEK